jgi:hypothetical protein
MTTPNLARVAKETTEILHESALLPPVLRVHDSLSATRPSARLQRRKPLPAGLRSRDHNKGATNSPRRNDLFREFPMTGSVGDRASFRRAESHDRELSNDETAVFCCPEGFDALSSGNAVTPVLIR